MNEFQSVKMSKIPTIINGYAHKRHTKETIIEELSQAGYIIDAEASPTTITITEEETYEELLANFKEILGIDSMTISKTGTITTDQVFSLKMPWKISDTEYSDATATRFKVIK